MCVSCSRFACLRRQRFDFFSVAQHAFRNFDFSCWFVFISLVFGSVGTRDERWSKKYDFFDICVSLICIKRQCKRPIRTKNSISVSAHNGRAENVAYMGFSSIESIGLMSCVFAASAKKNNVCRNSLGARSVCTLTIRFEVIVKKIIRWNTHLLSRRPFKRENRFYFSFSLLLPFRCFSELLSLGRRGIVPSHSGRWVPSVQLLPPVRASFLSSLSFFVVSRRAKWEHIKQYKTHWKGCTKTK